jgi:8-oxo-dGTP pyrophosphatase MutT (NUDIX family)
MDDLFAGTYNSGILATLEQDYGQFQEYHVDLEIATGEMFRIMNKITSTKPRRGEVVMVVPDPQGAIWLHTKEFYPDGVYRLMTGGLDAGEAPAEALQREVEEETGFKVEIVRCLAVITYQLIGPNGTIPFVSYLFVTTPGIGLPQPTDPNEAISGFRKVKPDELENIAQHLRSLNGKFKDWGIFRAVAHTAAAAELAK